jgi:hypothetical protein
MNIKDYIPDFNQLPLIISTSAASVQFIYWYKKYRDTKEERVNKIKNVFDYLENADFSTGKIPPDDWHSLSLFKQWFIKYFRNNRDFLYHRDLGLPDINKDLCSIGGPVDHILSRHGMCYDKYKKDWKPILPYIFPIEEAIRRREMDDEKYSVKRMWGKDVWTTTRWFISDKYGKRIEFEPEKDDDGFLCSDVLMLTVSPNTLTKKAFKNGKIHLMITPAHGLAQLAIKDVLQNEKVLEKLNKEREKSLYFQAIIKINAKRKRKGYVPLKKPGNIITRGIDIDEFEKIPIFKDWIKMDNII